MYIYIYEQIELQAKLLNYFLGSNKSNINQYICVFLYVYMHIYMDVYMCVCVCICVYMYICMYMYVYLYMYMSLYRMYVHFVSFNIGE